MFVQRLGRKPDKHQTMVRLHYILPNKRMTASRASEYTVYLLEMEGRSFCRITWTETVNKACPHGWKLWKDHLAQW